MLGMTTDGIEFSWNEIKYIQFVSLRGKIQGGAEVTIPKKLNIYLMALAKELMWLSMIEKDSLFS